MTQQEMKEKLYEMVENKCNEGFNRMKDMPVCEKFYNDMAKQGYVEQAQTFKSIVLYTTILHPEMTDRDIFMQFAQRMGAI